MVGIDAYILLMFLIAIVAGLIGAMVGVGGGILVVPALSVGFGVPIAYAIGASIISVIATSSGSASSYVRERITNLRIGIFLEVSSVLGSLLGVGMTLYFVRSGLSSVIFVVFGLVLFYSAYNVVQNMRFERRGRSLVSTTPDSTARRFRLTGEYHDEAANVDVSYAATRVPAGFAVVFFAGVIAGLLGVGGGLLKVLGMDTVMRLPFKVSTTTSNFMIGVTASASAGILFVGGYINLVLAAPVALGVVVGSFAGSRVLVSAKTASIRVLFVAVLLGFAVEMVLAGVSG